MGLIADTAAGVARPSPGGMCGVARVLALLEPDDREDLAGLLARTDVGHTTVEAVLESSAVSEKYGGQARLAAFTIGWHRRGKCSCPRPDQTA